MAAPTQVLPSWLTLSTTVITLPDGSFSTSSDTLTLPLTYYGPSIPLGTDGVWTYGGLTPPPSTTISATPTATSVSPSTTAPPTVTTTPTPTSQSTTQTSTSLTSSSAIPTTPAGSSSHGISPSILGAILGSILGTLLLLLLIGIIFLLRHHRKRHDSKPDPKPQEPSSSFYNRSTTFMSDNRDSAPIWTGWSWVDHDDIRPSRAPSPGEGSPRQSGEEADPFLTRRSVHSDTEMGHARTDTDTLVSLPAIARTGTAASHRSSAKPAEHIIPRDVQLRIGEELGDVPPYASVRMVERRASTDQESPLLPPRPLDPDSLGMASRKQASSPSLGSEKSNLARSTVSEKSLGSIGEPDSAELLTARRVKVAQIQPLANPATTASTSGSTSNVSGLDRLASLGRMSWFKRMSFLSSAPAGSQPIPRSEQEAAANDAYTRTPPRHSRTGSRSRPGSASRPGSFARVSAHEPAMDSFGRRVRNDSGVGLSTTPGDRPISSVSGKSEASGNTIFYDARSRPGSSMGTRSTGGSGSANVPPVPPVPQAHLPLPSPLSQEVRRSSPGSSKDDLAAEYPPTYEAATRPQSMAAAVEYSDIDVLDMPVPRPASPFTAASGARNAPPGLPTPAVWRNSHAESSSRLSPTTDSTSNIGINIDVLEDAPPAATGGWLSLAGGLRPTDGRRLTFGVPMVVQPQDALQSERGSLHSVRSHLSPFSSRSPSGSAGASTRRTPSGSSRPSASSHSRGLTGESGNSLVHSPSTSFDDHRPSRPRAEVGEVGSPPLSAVFPGRGFPSTGSISPPLPSHPGSRSDDSHTMPPAYPVNAPVPVPISMPIPVPAPAPTTSTTTVNGTFTSLGTQGTTMTEESLTDLSVTTTQTDPITGAVVHFPRVPWRSGSERPGREDAVW